MRNGFVECRHPNLPKDQTAFFKYPRNGWKPIKTSSKKARSDAPTAGESNDNKEQEQSS